METTTSARTADDVRARLIADHRAMDVLFEKLLEDVHAGSDGDRQTSWARFERALLDHIDAEEVYLLPVFERKNPVEAAGIRQEHATLRHLLADMGVRLELHAVREENVKRLVVALRTHAAREEALMYAAADDLAPDLSASLVRKLSAQRKR